MDVKVIVGGTYTRDESTWCWLRKRVETIKAVGPSSVFRLGKKKEEAENGKNSPWISNFWHPPSLIFGQFTHLVPLFDF